MAAQGNTKRRGSRISLPGPEEMNEAQKRIYDEVLAGPRGIMVGPLRAVIHSPELAGRWQKLGEYVRYNTVIPEKLKELAILVTAKRWNSELEWTIHRPIAEKSGLSQSAITTVRDGCEPDLQSVEEIEIYEFVRELQTTGSVSDAVYSPVFERWGERGIVELTAVTGYYTMVAMMLNAHKVPLPEGTDPDLGVDDTALDGLHELPLAGSAKESLTEQ